MFPRLGAFALACISLADCRTPPRSKGENLARTYCAACHAFPEPQLLDKKSWQAGVLPQMALRLGAGERSLFSKMSQNPHMVVLSKAVSADDWQQIVGYYLGAAPDTLPDQSLPAVPQLDPDFFKPGPFVARMNSSAIITLLRTDSAHGRIFVGEAAGNQLQVFDWNRHLLATLPLGSPPTDVIADQDRILVLESGILEPNDEPKGTLAQYDAAPDGSLHFRKVFIDSL